MTALPTPAATRPGWPRVLRGAGRGAAAAVVIGLAGAAAAHALGVTLIEDPAGGGDALGLWPVLQLAATGLGGSSRSLVATRVLGLETEAIPLGWTLLTVMVLAAALPRRRGLPRLLPTAGYLGAWSVLHVAVTVTAAAVLRERTGTLVELDALPLLTASLLVGLVAVALRALVDARPGNRLLRRLRAQLLAGGRVALGSGAVAGAAAVALSAARSSDGADALLLLALAPAYALNWMTIGLTGALGGRIQLPPAAVATTPVELPDATLVQLLAEATDMPVAVVVLAVGTTLLLLLGRAALGIAREVDWRSGTEVAVDVLGTVVWFAVAVTAATGAATIRSQLVAVPSVLPNPLRTVAVTSTPTAVLPVVLVIGLLAVLVLTTLAMRTVGLAWTPAPAAPAPPTTAARPAAPRPLDANVDDELLDTLPPPDRLQGGPRAGGSSTDRRHCTRCGRARDPDAAFCTGCGNRFDPPTPPRSSPTDPDWSSR